MKLNNSNILITGGTGSFGKKFVELTLKNYKPNSLIIYSRDEIKQWEMREQFKAFRNIKFIIGDVRDLSRLNSSLSNIDHVVHAAATKIVPTAESNPSECIKTNVIGAMNVIEASINNNIKSVVALSTDKACNPINLYGASKLASDKLFLASNKFDLKNATKFSVVRYGNVMLSRGSVIPYFIEKMKNKEIIPITDESMTRFLISLEDAIKLVWDTFLLMKGGEIFIKKIPSIKLTDIAKAIDIKNKYKVIGIRPGEKIHEQMITSEDSEYTYEFKDHYRIIPMVKESKYKINKNKLVKKGFEYISNTNQDWINDKDLRLWLKQKKYI